MHKFLLWSSVACGITAIANGNLVVVNPGALLNGQSITGHAIYYGEVNYLVAEAGTPHEFADVSYTDELEDTSITPGFNIPCYIIDGPTISNNSGPYHCGNGDYSERSDLSFGSDNLIKINTIISWHICTVSDFEGGWVSNTVVGAWSGTLPVGPGIRDCHSISGLRYVPIKNATAPQSTSTLTTTAVITVPCTKAACSGPRTQTITCTQGCSQLHHAAVASTSSSVASATPSCGAGGCTTITSTTAANSSASCTPGTANCSRVLPYTSRGAQTRIGIALGVVSTLVVALLGCVYLL